MTRGDAPDLGHRIDEPALRRHVRDRDQLCARTDRALECLEVELPGRKFSTTSPIHPASG
jgi:hypothetical protein